MTDKQRLNAVYNGMIYRCNNLKNRDYGGRGIKICDEWKESFENFYEWAISSGYKFEPLPSGRNKWTIDRINNDGNYEPSNCRWATHHTQRLNQRPRRKKIRFEPHEYFPSGSIPNLEGKTICRAVLVDWKGTLDMRIPSYEKKLC